MSRSIRVPSIPVAVRALFLAPALAAAVSAALLGGCSRKEDDGTAPRATDEKLPALQIADDTPNLMLTWLDEKGDTHVELHPPDVPAAGRAHVRVVVTDREDGTRDLFYVADLTQKRADGTYLAQTMPRRAWEALIEGRRKEYLAKTSPPPLPGAPSAAGDAPPPGATSQTGVTAVIYGADWCGPCHEAAAYLRKRGVQIVEKNIEKSAAAEAEMRDKLAKSGQHGGSIPVIDVRGEIIVGFRPSSLDRALAKAANGTIL